MGQKPPTITTGEYPTSNLSKPKSMLRMMGLPLGLLVIAGSSYLNCWRPMRRDEPPMLSVAMDI